MDRCPHCGRKVIKASRKFYCFNIFTLYNFLHPFAIRFMGGRCPECNKHFIPKLPLLYTFFAGIVLMFLQIVFAAYLLNIGLIPLFLLFCILIPFLPWTIIGLVGLFFPNVKYSFHQRKQIKPFSNGIVELKSNIKIKKSHIYGFKIYDEQQTELSKKFFDDNVIPVRFIRTHTFKNRWFVEIFNKDYIPESLMKDKTDFVLLKSERKVGNVTYRRVDSY